MDHQRSLLWITQRTHCGLHAIQSGTRANKTADYLQGAEKEEIARKRGFVLVF